MSLGTAPLRWSRLLVCSLLLTFMATPTLKADFNYLDFLDMTGLTLVGNAAQSGDRIRLTPSLIGQIGAVYTEDQILLGFGFDTTFTYEINPAAGGADGMVFIIQNESPTALYSNGDPHRTKPAHVPQSGVRDDRRDQFIGRVGSAWATMKRKVCYRRIVEVAVDVGVDLESQ